MSSKKNSINEIINLITRWVSEIQSNNALNYYDINKVSEGTAMKLLNMVFSYKLKDLNHIESNFPGIDLGDEENGIAIQITSQTDSKKIKNSLEKFYSKGLDKIYPNGMKLFSLSIQKKNISQIKAYEERFDVKKDVINFTNLIKEIEKLYDSNNDKFIEIYNFLHEEFGNKKDSRPFLNFQDVSHKLSFYNDAFRKIHAADCEKFISYTCVYNNQTFNVDDFIDNGLPSDKIIILGSSGLGKSMLSKKLALHAINQNYIPVFIEAKYFESDLESLLYREVKILGYQNAGMFFQACKTIGKNPLLLIDGLNECSESNKARLIVQLMEINKQYNTKLIISTQSFDNMLSDLNASIISIDFPDLETKKAIAGNFGFVDNKMEPLLKLATTNFEAAVIGELGSQGLQTISRFNLFDLFVRKKLLDNNHCVVFLSSAAEFLSENITFSISRRQIESILADNNLDSKILKQCISSGILKQKIDRFSFSHEILLNFFIADSISRFSVSSKSLANQTMLPKNKDKQLLILGSIEDRTTLLKVLEIIEEPKMIYDIVMGECGQLAKQWGENKLDKVISKLESESKNLEFILYDDKNCPVIVSEESLLKWESQELSFVLTIPELLAKGLFFEEMLGIVRIMNQTCSNPKKIISEKEASSNKFFSTRFSLCFADYFGSRGPRPVVSRLFKTLHSGFMAFNDGDGISVEQIDQVVKKGNVSDGELLLLLLLSRWRDEKLKLLFPIISDILKNKWKKKPYHLKIEILQKVAFCYEGNIQKKALIESLSEIHSDADNVFMSSMIFDSLSEIGALEDDEIAYEETVNTDLQKFLKDSDNEEYCTEVYGIYHCQFDHPYSNAFGLAISKLNEKEIRIFYTMALKGVNFDLFGMSLLMQAEYVLGKDCCHYLKKFFDQPLSTSSMPRETMSCCITSYILLGIYKFSLYDLRESEKNEVDILIHACGKIFYWLNRVDLKIESRIENCENLLNLLFQEKSEFLIDLLRQVHRALYSYKMSNLFQNKEINTIYDYFQKRILTLARYSIQNPASQKTIYLHSQQNEILMYSISLVEKFGNEMDIELLFELTDDQIYGSAAVSAIKTLSHK
ncbi:ATP-binding protein [Chryseobacterium capnotolerans]|uniref:SMEK domain-containing protein n=1 Tax=Chryseobacterium TaxID=59732 RepID=UPI00083ADBE7|nr:MULTISPECIES: SMEK domain-containing protein [Chryseobacterium]UHO37248.1 ATP-binding protein [Chryseobacterium capnotolerans]